MGDRVYDDESLSEGRESIEDEDYDWSVFAEPCPRCGSTEFLEARRQLNVVRCDEEAIREIEPQPDTVETLGVRCRGCDLTLYGVSPSARHEPQGL